MIRFDHTWTTWMFATHNNGLKQGHQPLSMEVPMWEMSLILFGQTNEESPILFIRSYIPLWHPCHLHLFTHCFQWIFSFVIYLSSTMYMIFATIQIWCDFIIFNNQKVFISMCVMWFASPKLLKLLPHVFLARKLTKEKSPSIHSIPKLPF